MLTFQLSTAQLLCGSAALGYSFIGEPAGFVCQHSPVDVPHHFLVVNTKISQMSSMAFGGGLARLVKSTAERQENQRKQDDTQEQFTNRSFFHHFSLSKVQKPQEVTWASRPCHAAPFSFILRSIYYREWICSFVLSIISPPSSAVKPVGLKLRGFLISFSATNPCEAKSRCLLLQLDPLTVDT
jgi:hypothetical protein